MPRPEIRDLVAQHFVCVADDADRMSPALRALGAKHMANARTLPFVIVTDADGAWRAGTSGFQRPEAFLAFLQGAIAG